MHFLLTLSFVCLSLAEGNSARGALKEELIAPTSRTLSLFRKEYVDFCLSYARSIVSAKIVSEEEAQKWKHFIEQWTVPASMIADNESTFNTFKRQMKEWDAKQSKNANKITNGAYESLYNTFQNRTAERFRLYEEQANEIISKAKESTGYSDYFLETLFGAFCRSEPNSREDTLKKLLEYLNVERNELEWLASLIMSK